MALSGSVITNAYDGRYLKLDWTATQNAVNNTSTITWTLSAVGGNSTTYATGPVRVRFATNTGIITYVYEEEARSQQPTGVIARGSTTFEHPTNGTLTVVMIVVAAIFMMSVNCEGDGKFVIDPIPQTPTAPTSVTATAGNGNYVSIGDTATIMWSGASGVITGYEWAFRWFRQGAWEAWSASRSVSTTATSGSATQGVTSTAAFAGDRLQFRVRAMNGSLASPWASSNSLTVVGGMRVKINGAWEQGLAFVKVNGEWKRAQHVYVKVNGVWKESI